MIWACGSNGGTGIGAGHECRCIRPDDHPFDSDRPHGCDCGAMWGDRCTHCRKDIRPIDYKLHKAFIIRGVEPCCIECVLERTYTVQGFVLCDGCHRSTSGAMKEADGQAFCDICVATR